MIPNNLRSKYYLTRIRVKHMGKNKEDKLFHTVEWNPERTRREFIMEYEQTDQKGCGLFFVPCGVE